MSGARRGPGGAPDVRVLRRPGVGPMSRRGAAGGWG
jgi:hypothetical protein